MVCHDPTTRVRGMLEVTSRLRIVRLDQVQAPIVSVEGMVINSIAAIAFYKQITREIPKGGMNLSPVQGVPNPLGVKFQPQTVCFWW